MTIEEAKKLIAPATILPHRSQQWADLGCGNGTFSYALASLLPEGSNIICVDNEPQSISPFYDGKSLRFEKADIQHVSFEQNSLSGILIANALHYIKDQQAFIKRLDNFLTEEGSWIIVEYDTVTANPWIPYPVSFNRLKELFKGYGDIHTLGERQSVYGHSMLYACQVKRRGSWLSL
jgi:ubiquinone/menaquinone biosynthesis C-methylase UbiE